MKELEVNSYIDDNLKAIYELKISESIHSTCSHINAKHLS